MGKLGNSGGEKSLRKGNPDLVAGDFDVFSQRVGSNEVERLAGKVEREEAGSTESARDHGSGIGISGKEPFVHALHFDIKALVGNVDPSRIGIAAAVAEDVHELEGLSEASSDW